MLLTKGVNRMSRKNSRPDLGAKTLRRILSLNKAFYDFLVNFFILVLEQQKKLLKTTQAFDVIAFIL